MLKQQRATLRATVFAVIVISIDLNQSLAQVPSIERDALLTLFETNGGTEWKRTAGWDTSPDSAGTECTWYGVECSEGTVVSLDLTGNRLTGSIPAELGNLANLELLELNFNELVGSIPSELGGLSKLDELNLNNNELSGSIPPELGNLNVRQLRLYRNQLTGTIPAELGNMANIEFLALYSNHLSGSIPPELGNLSTPRLHLRLEDNNLTGPIPPQLGNITNLLRLELDSNQLTGPIPPELADPPNLEHLYVMNNQLQGLIPPEILDKRGLDFRYENNPELILGGAPNTVLIGDREWRQVADTKGISWVDVWTVCDDSTGECFGIAGSVDLTGWTWASVDDVNGLFSNYLTQESLGPGPDRIEMDKSAWAPALLSDFLPTRTTSDFVLAVWVRGYTRTTSKSDSTQALEGAVLDALSTPGISVDDKIYTDQLKDKNFADQYVGHWLYRDVFDQPPGKITMNSDGSFTSARVSGGVTRDGGITYVTDVNVGDTIQIHVSLLPEAVDIGANSEIFVVALAGADYLLVTPGGLVSWDGQIGNLETFAESVLAAENELNILDPFGGEFTLTTAEVGSFRFFVGYTTEGGVITHNSQAIELYVNELPVN